MAPALPTGTQAAPTRAAPRVGLSSNRFVRAPVPPCPRRSRADTSVSDRGLVRGNAYERTHGRYGGNGPVL